jgi:hypothetical protein
MTTMTSDKLLWFSFYCFIYLYPCTNEHTGWLN